MKKEAKMNAPAGAITSIAFLVFTIIWSIRRLRNARRSAWWAFALIPPATILLLIYIFFAPSSKKYPQLRLLHVLNQDKRILADFTDSGHIISLGLPDYSLHYIFN